MPIVKTDVPMTYSLCRDTIEQLTQTYPVCTSQTLATTAFGREIEALRIGSGSRTVLFAAAFHANEWITATVLLQFAQELARAIMEQEELYGIPGRLFEENCQGAGSGNYGAGRTLWHPWQII